MISGVIFVLAVATNATPVSIKCLSKLNVLAGNAIGTTGQTTTAFDWTDEILQEFHTESVPMLKRSCLSSTTGDLNSFRIVVRGYDPRSNITSDSAGPSELGICGNKPAPV